MTDRTRFEQLALPHMAAAYNLAFHLLRGRADAEDAVQDAYVRAYRALHQLQGDDIKPWLLTIVRHVCYRRLQERRRVGNVISLDEMMGGSSGAGAVGNRPGIPSIEAELVSQQRSPEQLAISSSERAQLMKAIGQLAPVFREVIVLRELEELSYREIGIIIGAPAGTVMSRLSRARTELRELLAQSMDRQLKVSAKDSAKDLE
jgi:RNA polymerase sigma-70 factor, ECF subfamily